jgi:hypothetical protein
LSGSVIRGKSKMSSTVTAGITRSSHQGKGRPDRALSCHLKSCPPQH